MQGHPSSSQDQVRGGVSAADQLATQFYEWELRGRGWQLWDDPVRPEPPFRPFRGYRAVSSVKEGDDDGREHTLLSGWIARLSRALTGRNRPSRCSTGEEAVDESSEPEPPAGPVDVEWVEFRVAAPPDLKLTTDVAERFLLSATACRHPLAFELIGRADETALQYACAESDSRHVELQLQAHFPDVSFPRNDESLADRWSELNGAPTVVVEFGLSQEFVLPFVGARKLDADLLVAMAGTLEEVGAGELAVFQVSFEAVRHPWAASVLRAVATPAGDSLFADLTDVLGQAKAKVARPLYAAVVRVACRAVTRGRAWELARRLGRPLEALADPFGNELMALDNDGYDDDAHAADVPRRLCRRSGMILGSDELAALVHPPTADVRSPKLDRKAPRSKAAPSLAQGHRLVLGENEHGGRKRPVTLGVEHRVRHMHVVGASGTGKSTFLQNLIVQDVVAGEGLAVLDPHGDLIDAVLKRVPPERAGDVVLFDPADEEFPVGFNVLAAHSDAEKTLLASDLVGVFRRLSTSWGDQMNAVLANGVLAFLESSRGGTLADLRRFLVEPPYRNAFLETVTDPQIVYYWRKEFPMLAARAQGPVLTRLDAFLRPKAIRHVAAQRANRLDFAEIMDRGRIFLARLSHGAVGEENSHLLGALLVAKFHQVALGRQRQREADRRPFWLYVDEFQHFATPSMASLLSGVRKYRLGLILAHQELHQLDHRSPEVASAVISNAHTRICFRTGDQDARKLEGGFSSFDAADLQNLGIGEAIGRIERAEFDFNLRTPPATPVDDAQANKLRDRIVALSREKYAVPRAEVEAQLREGAEAAFADESPPSRPRKAPVPKVQPEFVAAAELPGQSPKPPPPALPPPPEVERKGLPPAVDPPRTASPEKPKRVRIPAEEVQLGRGGPEHKYLQQLIKQWAEGLGYRATIEAPMPRGQGSVDVAIEKKQRSIACLVSVTTSDRWELASVRKCLACDYQLIAMVAPNAQHLAKLRGPIEGELNADERGRVSFFLPDDLFSHVQVLEVADLQQERTVRGYKVRTTYRPVDAAEGVGRREAISQVVAKSIKRVAKRKP